MKKLLIGLSLFSMLVSCSKDEDKIEETPTVNYPCRYDIVLNKVTNPILSNTENERTIEFVISDYSPMILNEPNTENTSSYFDGKILESDFKQYQSHFTSLGNLNPPTSENIYIGKMVNGDEFEFDKNGTKESKKIKVTFHCIHIK